MSKTINQDWVNALLLALLIIGVVLIAWGVYQFIDTSLRIQNNIAYQYRTADTPVDAQNRTLVQGLVAADQELRELVQRRFNAMLFGGGGLVLTAVGWIAYDIVRTRRKRQSTAAAT